MPDVTSPHCRQLTILDFQSPFRSPRRLAGCAQSMR
jgi:hypothetical protein